MVALINESNFPLAIVAVNVRLSCLEMGESQPCRNRSL